MKANVSRFILLSFLVGLVFGEDDLATKCYANTPLVCKYATFPESHAEELGEDVARLLKQASRLYPDHAEEVYKKALGKAPNHPRVLLSAAMNQEAMRKPEKANHLFLLAVRNKAGKDALDGYEKTLQVINKKKNERISRLDQKVTALNSLLQDEKVRDLAWKEHLVNIIYHTNVLEGGMLSPIDIRTVMVGGTLPRSVPASSQHITDVINTAEAIEYVTSQKWELSEDSDVCEFINRVHAVVMGAGNPIGGRYRTTPSRVLDYEAPPPGQVADMMQELCDWFKTEEFRSLHPIDQAIQAHFHLAWIHPYEDGNGRTYRNVMDFFLQRGGYPGAIIDHKEKDQYYDTLHKANPAHGGDLIPFTYFVLDAVERGIDSYFSYGVKYKDEIEHPERGSHRQNIWEQPPHRQNPAENRAFVGRHEEL